MSKNLALAYGMKKRKSMGMKPEADSDAMPLPSHDDIVDRIIEKKYSQGGMVANDDAPMADSDSANFDDLSLRDDLEFSETGANSGDMVGNAREDEDRHDIIDKILRSRSKKDKNPNPA